MRARFCCAGSLASVLSVSQHPRLFTTPMFCDGHKNLTSASHIEFCGCFDGVQSDAKNKIRTMHVPQKPVWKRQNAMESVCACMCFIYMSIFNEKNQDHMKCPLQCAEQPLRSAKPCNFHSVAWSNRSDAKYHQTIQTDNPALQDAKDCSIESARIQ